ncbi:MAG: hypothetical protein LUQ18_09420 [Methylococcaceae bacterium]|nr:hypothetical protein [Methylococcaceae bacterium]
MTAINNTLLASALGRSFHVEFLTPLKQSGVYLIDSVNFHRYGQVELGLSDSDGDHFGCYTLNRDITIKQLKLSVSDVRDDLCVLHEAYDSLHLLTTDTEMDAPRLSGVIQILNYRFDYLLCQLHSAIR